MLSALLPAHLHFDTSATVVRADQLDKLDLVARFLNHHPAQTVEIVGHADSVGAASFNLDLGRKRADSVRSALIARGVPAAQIRGARSEGESRTISTSAGERWRDRRVEIVP
jgi:outer membrane protein OmpA-like peptidoglycan-associated protein